MSVAPAGTQEVAAALPALMVSPAPGSGPPGASAAIRAASPEADGFPRAETGSLDRRRHRRGELALRPHRQLEDLPAVHAGGPAGLGLEALVGDHPRIAQERE